MARNRSFGNSGAFPAAGHVVGLQPIGIEHFFEAGDRAVMQNSGSEYMNAAEELGVLLVYALSGKFPRLLQQAADENTKHAGAAKKEGRISFIRRDALDANPWGAKGYRCGKSQNHGSCSSAMCLRHYPS